MSTVKSKKLQVGTDATSSNNFTIYQPATPDGTLRIGVGNADSPTEVGRFDNNGYVATNAPAFSCIKSANQSITTSTSTKISFDTKEFDLTSDFDTSTYRFTPSIQGYYQFNLSVFMDCNNTQGMFRSELYKNGGLYKRTTMQADSTPQDLSASGSILAYANGSTDYFEMYVYHNLGSTRSLYSNSTLTYFQGCLIRAT